MIRTTLARSAAASGGLLAVGLLGLGSVAAAHAVTPDRAIAPAAAKAGGSFTFVTGGVTVGGKEQKQVALVHGAVNGSGLDISKGQHDTVRLPGGSITVTHPNATSTFTPHVDPRTCYATFKLTGTFTLTGTGRYAADKGSGRYVGHGTGYLKRTASGACNMKAAPQNEIFTVTGRGTLD